MGPITHAVSTRAIGSPMAAGLWMDAPVLLGWKRGAELTHGLPGLALSLVLGRRWVAGWALHVALDTVSHDDGGATGKGPMTWMP